MRGHTGRVIATIAMWVILGAVSIVGGINASLLTGSNQSIIVVGPLVIALAGMFVLWVLAPSVQEHPSQTEIEKGKRQSGDKLTLLLEMMDEDERAAFKETLRRRILQEPTIDADGEIAYGGDSLESLFEDEQGKRLRR